MTDYAKKMADPDYDWRRDPVLCAEIAEEMLALAEKFGDEMCGPADDPEPASRELPEEEPDHA